ncbi:hypothetical protein J6590_015187 [Homalodisca vitripennis]|nr:hypothetical protein J6590_015187 [Homalodisca vitripennis]
MDIEWSILTSCSVIQASEIPGGRMKTVEEISSRAREDYKATLTPKRAHTVTRAALPTCSHCADGLA